MAPVSPPSRGGIPPVPPPNRPTASPIGPLGVPPLGPPSRTGMPPVPPPNRPVGPPSRTGMAPVQPPNGAGQPPSRTGMRPVGPPSRTDLPPVSSPGASSQTDIHPITPSRSGMNPIAPGDDPADLASTRFDQERFDAGMTDPGPFGWVPFESSTRTKEHDPSTSGDLDDVDPPDDFHTDADGDEPADEEPAARTRRRLPFWVELPILVVVALLLTFTIQTFVARVYVIPSGSMELTLNGNNGSGDRILVDKVVYDFHSPRPGDVIVFKGPPGWDQTEFYVDSSSNPVTHWLHQLASSIGLAKPDEYDLVKRVIAVGGQTVACCDAQHRILVNNKPLDEPYLYWEPGRGGPAQQKLFGPVKIPPGYLWVQGDNRNDSDDSRYQNGGGIHGIVPVANVIGKARTIIWPPSRWRGIGDHDPQTMAVASAAPSWFGSVPQTGVGVLASLPTLWLGRRFGTKLREAAGIPQRKRRRKRPV